jgi:hypothetical protein
MYVHQYCHQFQPLAHPSWLSWRRLAEAYSRVTEVAGLGSILMEVDLMALPIGQDASEFRKLAEVEL